MGKGTGLGLSLSRNIIIMHKGLIEVESEEEKGTRVIITLRISK
jgi:signal transduction histidine kinase